MPQLLISVVVTLIVVGIVLYLVSMIPMDPAIHNLIRIAVLVIVCLWLLSLVVSYLPTGFYPHRS